jgi:inorganic pyrophosphatase
MTNFAKLPTWADRQHVYAVVETPRGRRAKFEFDPKLGAFTLAKPLLAGLTWDRVHRDRTLHPSYVPPLG